MSLDSLGRRELVEAVRRFVRERLVPQERAVSESDAIPDGIVAEMRALGLFGLSTPAEYGGLGLGVADEMHVAFEIGQTSPAFRSLFGTNVGIGYYRLFSNSTVDAFLSTSNYSGQYSYFNNLISLVQVQTGALYLTFNRVP